MSALIKWVAGTATCPHDGNVLSRDTSGTWHYYECAGCCARFTTAGRQVNA